MKLIYINTILSVILAFFAGIHLQRGEYIMMWINLIAMIINIVALLYPISILEKIKDSYLSKQ